MSTLPVITDPQVVARIDAIIRELESLRRQLTAAPAVPVTSSLVEELFGAAGHGTRDEYDMDLDWLRFGDECAAY